MTDDRVVPTEGGEPAEAFTIRYELADDESPGLAVVDVLSAVTDREPTDLGPLGDHVDLEAVDDLLVSAGDPGALGCSVVLTVDGLTVLVTDAAVVVTDDVGPSDGES